MKTLRDVEVQLARVGFHNKVFGKPEVKELCHILTNDEQIIKVVNGRYEGGFALLVATDRRLLLIDKKPWFLTLEDVRYDMISEVDYFARLLDATVSISSFSKTLKFTCFRQQKLRDLTVFVQHKVMDLRQNENQWQQYYQRTSQPLAREYAQPQSPQMLQYPIEQISAPQQMPPRPQVSPITPRPSLLMRRRHSRFYGTVATSASTSL